MPKNGTSTPTARRRGRLIELCQWANALAPNQSKWRAKNQYFHSADETYLRFLVQEKQKVLEVGCGTGNLLAALKPRYGVGLDLSPEMIQIAAESHPDLHFFVLDDSCLCQHIFKLGNHLSIPCCLIFGRKGVNISKLWP